MTSRDGYDRNRPGRGANRAPQAPQRPESSWKLDADELDRYMSGQPAREPRFDPYARSQSTGRTETAPAQPARRQPLYDDYAPVPEQDWEDGGFEDEYDSGDYFEEPIAPVRQQTSRQAPRARQYIPEPEDDLYEDPYVLDDEDLPRRPPRSQQRPARRQPQRPAVNFSMPTFVADAPIVQDSKALMIAGAGLASLLIMIIVVATQRAGLSDVIYTHVNANGDPEHLQEASAIWNLPLIAGMVTLISSTLAWFLARWSSFLPRFLLGGALGVQFIVWVAVFAYLF